MFGFPVALLLNKLLENYIIIDYGFGYKFRFSEIDLLNLFYDGFHLEPTILNYLITLIIGYYISFLFVSLMFKIKKK